MSPVFSDILRAMTIKIVNFFDAATSVNEHWNMFFRMPTIYHPLLSSQVNNVMKIANEFQLFQQGRLAAEYE
ncbi:MAG: hypothetical protein KAI17_23300 [Thiotrichaceae bacterium]|nr:hypothetical protein [Thiotrichaceae bacterium]